MKYMVRTSAVVITEYIVEAKSKKSAEQIYNEFDGKEVEYHNEQIESIELIK